MLKAKRLGFGLFSEGRDVGPMGSLWVSSIRAEGGWEAAPRKMKGLAPYAMYGEPRAGVSALVGLLNPRPSPYQGDAVGCLSIYQAEPPGRRFVPGVLTGYIG